MGNFEQNKQAIQNAFVRFSSAQEQRFREGMENVLDFAVERALESHDDRHQMHLVLGDSYGWVLYHNGTFVSKRIWGSDSGTFSSKLLGTTPSNGWCGVIMAGMQPAYYFAVRYEFWVLRQTMQDLKDNGCSRFFRRVNE